LNISNRGSLIEVHNFELHFCRPNKITAEIYGLSDLIRKILLYNRAALLAIIQPGIMDAFFKAVGAFSCLVIQQATVEESVSAYKSTKVFVAAVRSNLML